MVRISLSFALTIKGVPKIMGKYFLNKTFLQFFVEHPGDRQYVITLDEGSEETIEQKNIQN